MQTQNKIYTGEVFAMNMPTLLQDQGISQDVVSAMDAIVSFRRQGINQAQREAGHGKAAEESTEPRPRYCTFGGSIAKSASDKDNAR